MSDEPKMYFYDYLEWSQWPETDIREYASELASYFDLSDTDSFMLESNMCRQCDYFGFANQSSEEEQDTKSGSSKLEIKIRTVGGGLTRRTFYEYENESIYWLKERKQRQRTYLAKIPFSFQNMFINRLASDALWRSNSLDVGTYWILAKGEDKPYEGLIWYASEIHRTHANARKQAELGNIEGAMFHAYKLGQLKSELELRLAHGDLHEKYESTIVAQRAAGRASAKVARETKQAAYHRHRSSNKNASRTEAARRAAKELGVSTSAVVRAFRDGLPD